jgi:hypothetical protein
MADQAAEPPTNARTPAEFLKHIKGKPVVVKLNSGVDYKGGYMAAAGRGQIGRSRPLIAFSKCANMLPLQVYWRAWTGT